MSTLTVAQVLTADDLDITAGLADLLDVTVGGRRVLFALNRAEGKLHELSVSGDGTLTVEATLDLSGTFSVGSDPVLALTERDGAPSLAISGIDPAAGAFVTLSAIGHLGGQVSEPAPGVLAGATTLALDDDTALITGRTGGGADLYLDTGDGLMFASGLADEAGLYLADVKGGLAHFDGPSPFVAVSSTAESGISVLRVDLSGALSLASSFGAAEGLPISTPSDLVALDNGLERHLVLASSGSSSLTVLRVDDDGDLWLADHVLDGPDTRFQSITTVDAIYVGDHAFVAAGGADGGVSLFTMLPTGRLIHLGSTIDTGATTLYRASSVSLSATTATLNLAVSSQWEAGITRLTYDISLLGAVLSLDDGATGTGTVGDDKIIGSDVGDTLDGGGGNDILFDGAGTDVLSGGAGADLFVFAADGTPDRIEDFQIGTDRLDLSAFDFLYDVTQLLVTPTTSGAQLVFGDETIDLVSDDGRPLSAADFQNADILNIDRPPVLKINQTLDGGPFADLLNGGPGDDTIFGADGNDWLTGAGGSDRISGGNGNDTLDGGTEDDVLDGNGGADTAIGGDGDDLIDGGSGGDLLYGDDFDWVDPV